MRHLSPFFAQLGDRIEALGGLHNAHLHLDRAGTLAATRRLLEPRSQGQESHLSLTAKHALIPAVHASECYDRSQIESRAEWFLDRMVETGTTRATTVVDTTADRVGLSALEAFLAIRDRRRGTLDLEVGAYSPLGFRDDEPARWRLLEAAAELADFVGLLPERDDTRRYPDHVGFTECCRRGLLLAQARGTFIHIHADQMNHPAEAASETVVRTVRELGLASGSDEIPWIWLVHVISPSTYDERRFERLVGELVDLNIGVICCPSAAISMRQYRTVLTPTGNSIARVLEMAAAGVHVRLGSDNICDITSPAGTPDLMHELFVLCNALRYYDVECLAALGAGLRLDAADQLRLQRHLAEDRREIAAATAHRTARAA
jgi:cytosine/adenosine deaminase-related metal-dependent hydrolase